jgi:hypothetical protein
LTKSWNNPGTIPYTAVLKYLPYLKGESNDKDKQAKKQNGIEVDVKFV